MHSWNYLSINLYLIHKEKQSGCPLLDANKHTHIYIKYLYRKEKNNYWLFFGNIIKNTNLYKTININISVAGGDFSTRLKCNCKGFVGDGGEMRDIVCNYYFYGKCKMKRQRIYFLKFKICWTINIFENGVGNWKCTNE